MNQTDSQSRERFSEQLEFCKGREHTPGRGWRSCYEPRVTYLLTWLLIDKLLTWEPGMRASLQTFSSCLMSQATTPNETFTLASLINSLSPQNLLLFLSCLGWVSCKTDCKAEINKEGFEGKVLWGSPVRQWSEDWKKAEEEVEGWHGCSRDLSQTLRELRSQAVA